MKIKNVFGLLIIFAFLITAVGVLPAGAHGTVSPMLKKGPQAVPVKVTSADNPAYGLFTCQLGEEPDTQCYDPYQMQHAYGIDTLLNAGFDGTGKTIVIIDAFQSPYIVDELNNFDEFYGLPGLNGLGGAYDSTLGTFTQIAPDGLTPFDENDGNMFGWAEEITLDVEWSHAIAPRANITLVLGKSNQDADLLSVTKYVVDNSLGDVISQSFGEDERCMDPTLLQQEHQVYADATTKHITIFASSGDNGAAQPTCDGSSYSLAASSPASDPLVTGVGGTTLYAADYCLSSMGCDPKHKPLPGTYKNEVAWNEKDSTYGDMSTGGGFSVLFNKPAYQKNLYKNNKGRGVPDVGYNAAVYHGVLTYLDIPGLPPDYVGFWLFGGTSAGSPQWSAIIAIADQKAGHDLGFINTALYKISKGNMSYSADFHDIKIGNNSVTEFDSNDNPVVVQGYPAKKNWDATVGLGSPKVPYLIKALIKTIGVTDGSDAITDSTLDLNAISATGLSGYMQPH